MACPTHTAPPTFGLQGDPFKTLFVGRLSYEVTERKLKREFEEFGPIKRVRLVHDKNTGAAGHCWLAGRLVAEWDTYV